jgi:hypothetical protein
VYQNLRKRGEKERQEETVYYFRDVPRGKQQQHISA